MAPSLRTIIFLTTLFIFSALLTLLLHPSSPSLSSLIPTTGSSTETTKFQHPSLPAEGLSLAFATFLTGPTERKLSSPGAATYYVSATDKALQDRDPQYLATRLLIYQLLHSPLVGANTTKIPLLILTTPSVPRRHIKRLRVDGATVLPIPPLSAPWIPTHGDGNPWLKDDLSRLHLFNLPPYDKILYLSPSTLLLRPLTPLFWDPAGVSHTSLPSPSRGVKDDEAPLPPTYLLASKPELLSRDHDGPDPDPGNPKAKRFSPSLFLFRPSPEVFTYLTSLLALRDRFNPLRPFANVLNYAFRLEGPMPWARVADGWGAEWANDEDLGRGVGSVVERVPGEWWEGGPGWRSEGWGDTSGEGEEREKGKDREWGMVRQLWRERRAEMEGFWRGRGEME